MRIIAWLILLIPGFIAAVGIKWMRDTFFDESASFFPYLWMQFIAGVLAFALGLLFIGGFILHRERKKGNAPAKDPVSPSDKTSN